MKSLTTTREVINAEEAFLSTLGNLPHQIKASWFSSAPPCCVFTRVTHIEAISANEAIVARVPLSSLDQNWVVKLSILS